MKIARPKTLTLADELLEALEEVRAHRAGEISLETRIVAPMSAAEIKAIRARTGLSQDKFAATYRIPAATLRNFEQGRSSPDAMARGFLKMIARDPVFAAEAVNAEDEAAA